MAHRDRPGPRHYRLELGGQGCAAAQVIEFEAEGPEAALFAAERHGGGREVTLFEDGCPLARLRLASGHGFWTVGPGPILAVSSAGRS